MTQQTTITTGQIIGIIVGSGILSGFLSALVAANSSKKDRKSNFRKEEFLTLQGKAEVVYEYIAEYSYLIKKMLTEISHRVTDFDYFSQEKQTELRERSQTLYKIMSVYFFDLRETYDEYAIPLKNCMSVYFDVVKNSEVTPENIEKLKASYNDMEEKREQLIQAVNDHLNAKRKEVEEV